MNGLLGRLHFLTHNFSFDTKKSQPVEKLLVELIRECMSLTRQHIALEGNIQAKKEKREFNENWKR
jgi:hypothetical protein